MQLKTKPPIQEMDSGGPDGRMRRKGKNGLTDSRSFHDAQEYSSWGTATMKGINERCRAMAVTD